ncbi:MAG TPA: hypothetical protein VGK21_08305 [Candidatus Angelobacter sp.]
MPEVQTGLGTIEAVASMTEGEIESMIGGMGEQSIRDWLKELNDEQLRTIHANRYDPVYLNLLAIFYKELPHAELVRVATQCTRYAIWSNRVLDRWMDTLPGAVTRDKKPLTRLNGFDPAFLRSLSAKYGSMIICTFRFGQYSLLPFEIALNGIEVVWPVKNTVAPAVEEARRSLQSRLDAIPEADRESDCISMRAACNMQILPVAEEGTSLKLLQALRKGQVVLMHADGNAGLSGKRGTGSRCLVQFANFSISVKTGIANLAWVANVPILPMIALANGMDAGQVICGEPIFRPDSGSASSRDTFVQNTMQSLYSFLEKYGRGYPEQWPGVAAIHRWRRGHAAVPPPAVPTSADARNLIQHELLEGRGYILNEASAIAALYRPEGWILVDMKSLKSFKPPEWAGGLLQKLCKGGGLSPHFIAAQAADRDGNHSSDTLALLAEFRRNGLITVI